MPIEGPLRELGIHDVFQLLDLSRKTGTLHVRSTLRDNEGTIFFGAGRVVYATIRSNPNPIGELLLRTGKVSEADLERALVMQQEKRASMRVGDILVEMGAITRRELERQMRQQVEEVIFELMSWHEGFFSFEEGELDALPHEGEVSISTESLLMEGARRIDEWSRISTRIPDLALRPALAENDGDGAVQLDLLPNEWEVLSMVDGDRSVRDIARQLGSSDFEVARVLYGLASTGIIRVEADTPPDPMPSDDSGDPDAGIQMHMLRMPPTNGDSDPRTLLELGYEHARSGRFADAVASWNRYLAHDPRGTDSVRAREALESAARLRSVIEAHYDGR